MMPSGLKAVVLVSFALPTAALWNTCPRGPVGSCLVLGCSKADGPTICEHHKCNCITGYCRYPNTRVHLQPRRCRAQVPGSSCHATRFCYKGGFSSTSCVGGRCLCRTGMHIGEDGQCHPGYWPDEQHCNTDTGGTCKIMGCSASRGPTTCTKFGWEAGTGHQCHCQKGYCATKQGTCRVQRGVCTKSTGGSCGFFGCHRSRNAVCQHGQCVCSYGRCAVNGVCRNQLEATAFYANETNAENFADQSYADEDWEVFMNQATFVMVIALPFGAVLGGVAMVRRLLRKSDDAAFKEWKLLEA